MSSQTLGWENVFPTSVDVREIKQNLMSGNQNEIWNSFERIKSYMNNDNAVIQLIRCDIPEFLCDVFTPHNSAVAEVVYTCLETMAKHSEFFTHSHLCFVIESLIRSVYFLLKSSEESANLTQCLNVLIVIVEGYNKYNTVPEVKTVHNLVQLLTILVKVPLVDKHQVGKLIFGLLDMNVIIWDQETLGKVSGFICSWFDSMEEILKSVGSVKENFILLGCMICCSLLRCLVSKDKSFEECHLDNHYGMVQNMIIRICYFLVEFAATYFEDSPFAIIEQDPSKVSYFYQAIFYLYSEDIMVTKTRLSHGLSEAGFLQFTTRVISLEDSDEDLRKICVFVLFSVVLSLSEDVFHFPEVWPMGRSDFINKILEGMSLLPLNTSHWLDVLADPRSNPLCKLAVLLYLYFYAMTAKSQAVLENIYPSIVSVMSLQIGLESSVFLVKVVWFIYVISALSKNSNSLTTFEIEAIEKMVLLLEAQSDFSLVYTHHPALLYWVFSYKISSVIQAKTVHLWLQNKTSDCKELEGLITKSSDARFAILGIMQTGSGQVLESAFLSLKEHLTEFQDEDLASNIWFLLPQILAKYTADPASAANADYMIELSSLKLPSTLDATKFIRIASLLPEVLVKSDLISVIPLLSLVHQLLQYGFRTKDSRVVNVFFRSNGFVRKILEGANASISDIALYSLRIMTTLWKNGKEIPTLQEQQKMEISKETVIKLLESRYVEVISASLDFLQEVLNSNFESLIFSFEKPDHDFLEILFLQVQNICIKDLNEIVPKCWTCLKLLLVLSSNDGYEFASNPLLHELITFHLPVLKRSEEMKEFLIVWINQNGKILSDICFSRKLFGKYYEETLRAVVETLGQGFGCNSQNL